MQEFGMFLARLGGADLDVLARAKQISKPGASKDQVRFVTLGLVLLATAAVAGLSMTFAMADGFQFGHAGAVLVGLFWGAIVLVVCRALILSIKPRGSKWLLLWTIVPRIIMAALLGLLISTPLTLRAFNDEIEHQMAIDNTKKAEEATARLANGDRQKQLDALKAEIARYEGYLAGDVPVTSADLVAAENEFKQANTDYQAKQAAAETARAAWRCELEGRVCEGSSGEVGNGPRAQALKRDYDRTLADADAARALVSAKQAALDSARSDAREQQDDRVKAARAQADRVLPGLRKQRDELQTAIQRDLEVSNNEAAADTGLLTRLEALGHLGKENNGVRRAHLLVAGLLFMLVLLPLAVKLLSFLGPPSAYDQIDDLDTKEVVRAAGRREYIDKDLEERKKRIAEAVHHEVEEVMRELAIAQVKAWKRRVERLAAAPRQRPSVRRVLVRRRSVLPIEHASSRGGATAVPGPGSVDKTTIALNLPPSTKQKAPEAAEHDRPPQDRWLSASLPTRASIDAEIDLLVRVVTSQRTGPETKSRPLKMFDVPLGGVRIMLIVEAPPGLRQLGPLRQTLPVPASSDSEPVHFTFRTIGIGLHDVTVTAWLGGTFVGEVRVQVAVGIDAVATHGTDRFGEMAPLIGRSGEATLQVLLSGDQYLFQLMIDDELFDTVPGETLSADPLIALNRARQTLRTMSRGRSGYLPRNAAKRLQAMGIGLWEGMVPRELHEQFWSIRDRISMFTIASARDTLPWELVYPMAPGRDAGFLIEQFPVLRRVHNQRRAKSVSLDEASFVIPAEAPRNATAEVAAIRATLGRTELDQDVVTDLHSLLALVEAGGVGVLHFACHNTFDPDDGGCIDLGGEAFVPEMLNQAAVSLALRSRSPLVFLNACSSGVDVHRFTDVTGFASQFIKAGAGIFVGTLWDVRSESAGQFATTFYRNLYDGVPLGEAVQRSRTELHGDGSDPTWLAYAVYGDPACIRRQSKNRGVT
jgi:hypothetical protein